MAEITNESLGGPARQKGDLSVQKTSEDSIETLSEARESEDMAPADRVADLKDAQDFGQHLVLYLEDLREKSKSAREETSAIYGGFAERLDRNRRRSRAKLEPTQDTDGTVVMRDPDGHASLGIQQGWTAQAVKNVAAFLNSRLFSSQKRPVTLMGRGNRQENQTVIQLLNALVDELMKRSQMRELGRRLTRLIPSEGTAFWRMEFAKVNNARMDARGQIVEDAEAITPILRLWPLEDVLLTHYDKPDLKDQQGIFFISPEVSLAELEREEVVMDVDPQTGQPVYAGGKFRNLEVVRRFTEKTHSAMPDISQRGKRLSVFQTGTLVEYEGALPLAAMSGAKMVNWPAMNFFGVSAGMDPDPNDDDKVTEFGRRLEQVRYWQVAYWIPDTSNMSELPGGTGIPLRIEPFRGKRPKFSAYVFGYQPDQLDFYHLSVTDLGRYLEDAGDCMRNDDILADYFNTHPPAIYDLSALQHQSLEEIQELLHTPNGLVQMQRPGTSISEVVQFMVLPRTENLEVAISSLKREFENTTGASAAAKGTDPAAGTGTLGEIQINESKSGLELGDIAMANANELARMIFDMMEGFMEYSGELFIPHLAKISGYPLSEVAKVIPSTDGLMQEIDVRHAMILTEDRNVQATMLLRAGQAFPQVFTDPKQLVLEFLQMTGFTRAEELVYGPRGMNPEDEHQQLGAGNWVRPQPNEDFQTHLMVHQQKFMELQRLLAGGGQMSPEDETLLLLLQPHMSDTQALFQQMMMIQAQMAGGGQGAPGGALGMTQGAAGPSRAKTTKPESTPAESSTIKENAHATIS